MSWKLALTVAMAPLIWLDTPVQAQQLCGYDSDGDGLVASLGETATCISDAGGTSCPLQAAACNFVPNPSPTPDPTIPPDPTAPLDPAGSWQCPTDPALACVNTSGSVPTCSPVQCVDTVANPPQTEPDRPPLQTVPDGTLDASGNCLGNMSLFAGRALDCRPPGIATTFKDCCKNRGKVVYDSSGQANVKAAVMGAAISATFSGMKAAYSAYKAGASASAAASAGASKMLVGLDPTTLAISIAVSLVIDLLLQGCNQEDMEVGVLRGSLMCHEVGSYCKIKVPLIGCVQEAKSHCCFNSKLGRILQEQGRPQLKSFAGMVGGIWGEVKNPNCRGFSPEEFQALDFSRIDMSEYYADLKTEAAGVVQMKVQEKITNYLSEMGQ
jgi:conjugal transfer mating pair stabilization protein TraN